MNDEEYRKVVKSVVGSRGGDEIVQIQEIIIVDCQKNLTALENTIAAMKTTISAHKRSMQAQADIIEALKGMVDTQRETIHALQASLKTLAGAGSKSEAPAPSSEE